MIAGRQVHKFVTVLLGPPGSGKGTIAKRILKDFDFGYVCGGDLLRWHINAGTCKYINVGVTSLRRLAIGLQAASKVRNGQLVPNCLILEVLKHEIYSNNHENLLLDGVSRNLQQAKDLDTIINVDSVIHLDVPFQEIIERLGKRLIHRASGRIYNLDFNPPFVENKDDVTGEPLEQREDDKPEVVRTRLELFNKEIAPVLDFYREKGVLHEFAGDSSNMLWPQVHKCISNQLEPAQFTQYS